MAHDIALDLPDPPPSSSLEQRHVDNSTAHQAAAAVLGKLYPPVAKQQLHNYEPRAGSTHAGMD